MILTLGRDQSKKPPCIYKACRRLRPVVWHNTRTYTYTLACKYTKSMQVLGEDPCVDVPLWRCRHSLCLVNTNQQRSHLQTRVMCCPKKVPKGIKKYLGISNSTKKFEIRSQPVCYSVGLVNTNQQRSHLQTQVTFFMPTKVFGFGKGNVIIILAIGYCNI